MPNYLVIATSGRAIAQSLKSLGNSVSVVDGFADSDTRSASNKCIKVNRTEFGLNADEVLHVVQELRTKVNFNGLFYDAAIESNPELLDEIGIKPVLGNSSQALKACKSSKVFFSALDRYSIPYPEISFQPNLVKSNCDQWLLKDEHGVGGVGVKPAQISLSGDEKIKENCYFQKRIAGVSFSITFLANCGINDSTGSEEIMVLGCNKQWSEHLSKTMPHAYSGAINQVKFSEEVKETAIQYAQLIAKEFKLVGLNSIDFICSNDKVYVLEVNPRIPATYELYETKYGELMQEHIETCEKNVLPTSRRKHLLRAHAIVYAPKDLQIKKDMAWPLWSADRPCADEKIKQSEPICNVFAGGQNSSQVYEMIENRKQTIIAKLIH